ncbi:small ribosomal subunit protein bS16m [Diutina catenulata]
MSAKSPIKIRLARFGRRHSPVYNIVVANRGKARDALPIEVLGTYNPIATPLTPEEKARGVKPFKDITLDFDRSKYWIGVGADVSDRVGFLFKRAGLLPDTWPKPSALTQQVEKRVINDIKEQKEEQRVLYRHR